MRLKGDRLVIAVTLESLKLAIPIDDASTHGRPIIAVRLSGHICNGNDEFDPWAKDYIHRSRASHHVRQDF
jgi:hypothetical protein